MTDTPRPSRFNWRRFSLVLLMNGLLLTFVLSSCFPPDRADYSYDDDDSGDDDDSAAM